MNLDNISDLESFWAEQIKSWQSTDLTQRAYCQKNARGCKNNCVNAHCGGLSRQW